MRLIWFLVPLLAGCTAAQRPDADSGGNVPTIVSLNPCTDAILAQVTAPGQLLAISHYSHIPAATSMPLERARQFAATGGSVEEVLALDPDMVVTDSFLPPASRAAFQRLGLRVETVGIASTVEQSKAQVRQLAALAGNAQAGEELAAQIDAAWNASAFEAAPVDTLMWQQGGIVPGPDSLIAQLMQHSGFALHSAVRGLGQGAYVPLEQVLADPPALVLAAGREPMLTHPVLRELTGTHYATFDPALTYCGGPTIVAALERLRHIREGLE